MCRYFFNEAKQIVRKAGERILKRDGVEEIFEKGMRDYVTAVDIGTQKFIFEELSKLDASVQFLGEEKDNGQVDQQGKIWILDPVDGTTNLIHDFQHSVISLAYREKGETKFGIIYNPFSEEFFEAELGKGAWLNEKPIHVSGTDSLSESLISVGTAPGSRHRADITFRRMRDIYDRCQDIRRMGAAALDLAYVACGRLDGYFEEGLHIWDFEAGMLLVKEAGGTAKGDESGILASSPGIFAEFEKVIYSAEA